MIRNFLRGPAVLLIALFSVFLGMTAESAGAVPNPTTTTQYAPSTTTTATVPASPFTTGVVLTVRVGDNESYQVPGFAPSSQTTITIDGHDASVTTTSSDGILTISIVWLDPHVSVNGGSPVPINYGNNTINLAGTAANGQPATFSGTFNLVSASTPVTAATTTGGLAFTGADIAAMAVVGLLLLACGTLLVVTSRRRRHASR